MIIIPRKHYTQPQGRVEIDWNAPAAQMLRLAVVPGIGLRDLVGSAPVTPLNAGPKVMRPAAFGMTYENPDSASNQGLLTVGRYRSDTPVFSAGTDQTLMYVASTYPRAASGYGAHVFIPLASTYIDHIGAVLGQSNSADWRYSIDTVSWFQNLSAFRGVLASTGPNNRPITSRRYFDAGQTLDNTINTAYGNVGFEGVHVGSSAGSARNVVGIFGWDRIVSFEEGDEIIRAPWQLFRADPIRIYSLPTGAISINSITASNITQTGARITLGLTR